MDEKLELGQGKVPTSKLLAQFFKNIQKLCRELAAFLMRLQFLQQMLRSDWQQIQFKFLCMEIVSRRKTVKLPTRTWSFFLIVSSLNSNNYPFPNTLLPSLSYLATPKYKHNHHADNMRKLIEIQYQKQQEKAAAAEPAPEPFKLQRFAHVESRLAQSGVSRKSCIHT